MRYSYFGTALTALLAGGVAAQDIVEDASVTSPAERPTFTPTNLKAPFLEQFTDDWETRWQPSHAKKEDSKSEEDWAYVGQWEVEEPTVLPGIKGDKGLVVKNPAAHHAISAKFPTAIDNKGQDLVVQYEVKLQKGLECGGAYMKLLQDNSKLASDEFSNASPYVIMFGPDKCGATNKVHFIFKHKNPKTGEYEEKHMKSPPAIKNDKLSHVYTLVVRKDNTFELSIDGKSSKTGSLLEDFTPSVNPPAEIDDPNDSKPEDWVDQAKIADPEAEKPADWDEDAPYEVVDTEAEKPADWLEDEPLTIPDPEAEKPEDWDDEEDGDWIPPQIPNPKCEEASGCGPWTPPMKRNPEYKGKWTAPLIDNPLYKGVWKPRIIQNPDFFEDKTPSNLEPMGAIGFEIWTMQSDISFDNIYIGHSEQDAADFRSETYAVKHSIEEAEDEASKPKPSEIPKSPSDLKFTDDPITYLREKLDLFVTLAKKDPLEAIRFMPETAAGLGVSVAALIGGLVLLVGGGVAAAPSKEEIKKTAKDVQAKANKAADDATKKATELKDQAVEATASGAQAVQEEVNKRTTRSTGKAE